MKNYHKIKGIMLMEIIMSKKKNISITNNNKNSNNRVNHFKKENEKNLL